MARTSAKPGNDSGKPANNAAPKAPRKAAGRPPSGASNGSAGTGMILLVGLPALAIAGVVAYFGSPDFRASVDSSRNKVSSWLESDAKVDDAVSLPSEAPVAAESVALQPEPDNQAEVPFRTDAQPQLATPPVQVQTHMAPPTDQTPNQASAKESDPGRAKTSKKPAKDSKATASAKLDSKPGPNSQKKQAEPVTKVQPKVQEVDLPVRAGGLTLRQTQTLVAQVFGGEVVRSKVSKGRDWYELTWSGGQQAAPFDVAPKSLSVSARALTGKFHKKHLGFIVFLNVTDPQAPEWTHTYLGAVLVAGTPEKPGRVLGTTAMQAPRGRFTRREARDLDNDGIAELILEVESHAPGGYLHRDLAIHKFGASGTQILFSSRTLEDGPGVPTQDAKFKEVSFQDTNQDGITEIVVKEGVRTFDIDETLYRTQTGQKVVATRTFKLTKGRYRIAAK